MRFAILLAILIAGCSPGTDPGPCTHADCLETIGYLNISRTRTTDLDSTTITDDASASFRIPRGTFTSYPVEAGTVKLNDVELVAASNRTYNIPSTLRGTFLLDMNHWTVSGSDDVPAFIDSIVMPAQQPRLLKPAPGDTIVIRDGLELQWRSTTNDSTHYQVWVRPIAPRTSTRQLDSVAALDTGVVSLEGTAIDAGPAYVEVVSRVYHVKAIGDLHRIVSISEFVERVYVVISD